MRPRVPGRALAWWSLLVALVISVSANVAYARPGVGPRLSAATAPVLVVMAAGLLERVELSKARSWQRGLAIGGLVMVVATALVTSYQHQYHLLIKYGNPLLSAVLLPFAVDASIVMSSVCLAVVADQRRAVPDTPRGHRAPATAVPDKPDMSARTPARTPARTRKPDTKSKVRELREQHPDMTMPELATRAGVHPRTVRRHLNGAAPALAPAQQ